MFTGFLAPNILQNPLSLIKLMFTDQKFSIAERHDIVIALNDNSSFESLKAEQLFVTTPTWNLT